MTDSYISDWTVTVSDPEGDIDDMLEMYYLDMTEDQAEARAEEEIDTDPELSGWEIFEIEDDND